MSTARHLQTVSVEDYLAGELVSPQKHEYLAGVVYAMAGARNLHNTIGGNIFAWLHGRLRGARCRPYNSDTKIRVQLPTHVRFYYPDTSVVCNSNPPDDSYQDEPVIVVEVLSERTRRIDEGEKKDAYLTISTLSVYLLVEQAEPAIMVYRRTNEGFVKEVYLGLDSVVPLSEIGIDLPLAEVYDGIEFTPEVADESV